MRLASVSSAEMDNMISYDHQYFNFRVYKKYKHTQNCCLIIILLFHLQAPYFTKRDLLQECSAWDKACHMCDPDSIHVALSDISSWKPHVEIKIVSKSV
jgi:hypothetical protein